MPRNGSGTMSVPNSFSSGTTISSSAVNSNFSDFATEVTNSLPRDGQAAMTGQLKAAAGTASAPGLTFGGDPNTGFYSKSADAIGITAGGAEVASITSSGLVDANSFTIIGMPTGAMLMYGATTAPTGWTRCNGRTIGNASSSATERANADTSSLFTFLWTNYADSVCAVSGGRGASAAADYAANKTIALPDLRGRAFFGLDDMGGTAASRLGTVITSATANGSSGGTETHTLTTAQLPATTPAGTVSTPTITLTNASLVQTATSLTGVAAGSFAVAPPSGAGSIVTVTASSSTPTFTGTPFGSGQSHSNMPPAFLTTFIIKL